MITEQKKLYAEIRAAEAGALKLLNHGVKISGVHQRLRAAGNELQTRLAYLDDAAKPPAVSGAEKLRAELSGKSKSELLELVLNHNTTPGNSELVLPENVTKAQLIEALLGVAK